MDLLFEDLDILRRGIVGSMRVPAGWSWGERRDSGSQMNSYQELFVAANPEVTIWFYYRGARLSEQSTEVFRRMLSAPEHLLTRSELASIEEIIKEQSDPQQFDVLISKTAELNGRKVVIIEGRYKETQLSRYHIYAEADPHGRGGVVQEIFYQAPKDVYIRHLSEARVAFSSIEWSNQKPAHETGLLL